MKTSAVPHLSNSVLRINVGFLLSDGPGRAQDSHLNIPSSIQVANDLLLLYLRGPLRLSRTTEGILVQAQLQTAVQNECSRCLSPIIQDIKIALEELYAIQGGTYKSEFIVSADGNLDLAPLLRAEVLLVASGRVLCQVACRGICPTCGANRNEVQCDCDQETPDPRFAKLRMLLETKNLGS